MTDRLRLIVSNDLAARIRRLPPELKRKVRASLDAVIADSRYGKPLRDRLTGLRSARVGRFRVVYRVLRDAIEVVTVGPRRTVYEEAERLVDRNRRDKG